MASKFSGIEDLEDYASSMVAADRFYLASQVEDGCLTRRSTLVLLSGDCACYLVTYLLKKH